MKKEGKKKKNQKKNDYEISYVIEMTNIIKHEYDIEILK